MKVVGLKGKIWFSFGILIVGFLCMFAVMCWTGIVTRSSLNTASECLAPAAASSQEADSAFQRMTKRYSDAFMTQDESTVKAADEDAAVVASALRVVVDKLPANSPRQKQAKALLDQFVHLRSKAHEVYSVAIHRTDITQGGEDVAAVAQETKSVLSGIEQLQSELANDFGPEMKHVIDTSRKAQMVGFALFLAVTIACVVVIELLVVRGVIGTLASAASDLNLGAAQIESAASEISSTSNDLAQGASEQAASLEETSSTAQEVNSMTRRNADHSQRAAELMNATSAQIEAANYKLEGMIASMGEINSSSLEMQKTVKLIDDIAFQTNILALNAAVEAARAGQAGAGFAVVADAVRNLAQRCASAAKDTALLIERSIATTENGKTKVRDVEEVIVAITKNGAEAKALVDEVSIASQEQAKALAQITVAVEQVESITQRSAASAEQSAAASEQLKAQAHSMHDIVENLSRIVGGSSATRSARVRDGHSAAFRGGMGITTD